MSNWMAHDTMDGKILDIFPTDSDTTMLVEYTRSLNLFEFKLMWCPDHMEGRHERTTVSLSLCGRSLQKLVEFLQENYREEP